MLLLLFVGMAGCDVNSWSKQAGYSISRGYNVCKRSIGWWRMTIFIWRQLKRWNYNKNAQNWNWLIEDFNCKTERRSLLTKLLLSCFKTLIMGKSLLEVVNKPHASHSSYYRVHWEIIVLAVGNCQRNVKVASLPSNQEKWKKQLWVPDNQFAKTMQRWMISFFICY